MATTREVELELLTGLAVEMPRAMRRAVSESMLSGELGEQWELAKKRAIERGVAVERAEVEALGALLRVQAGRIESYLAGEVRSRAGGSQG